jgi:hypothetical protein
MGQDGYDSCGLELLLMVCLKPNRVSMLLNNLLIQNKIKTYLREERRGRVLETIFTG